MSNKTGARITPGTDPSPQRPYHPPEFIVYGTVREITQSVNNVGSLDGGPTPGFMKTR